MVGQELRRRKKVFDKTWETCREAGPPLCFGRAGLAYIEADPAESDASTIVRNLLYGQYGHPLRVVAMNVEEGWCRDVSDVMADKVPEVAQREDVELTDGTLAFLEAHEPEVKQAMLPCGDGVRTISHPPRRSALRAGVSGPTQPAVGGNVLVAWELSERQGHPAILMPAGTRLQARLAGLFLVDSTPRAVAT